VPQKLPPELNQPGNAGPSKLILIGEDDLDDQELFKEIFDSVQENIQLEFVSNGMEVIQYLENCNENLPCLIILDYNMPELSGADILQRLQGNPAYDKIPKIIWSTSGSSIFKEKSIEFGATAYVIKPSNVTELKEVAHYMLSYCQI